MLSYGTHRTSSTIQLSTIFAIFSAVTPVVIFHCCGAVFCHSTTPNCYVPNA